MQKKKNKTKKKLGATDFVFEIKRVKNYPNFEKSVLVTPHDLSGC